MESYIRGKLFLKKQGNNKHKIQKNLKILTKKNQVGRLFYLISRKIKQ